MGEELSGREDQGPETGPEQASKVEQTTERTQESGESNNEAITKLVAQRWERLNELAAEFRERDEEESKNPVESLSRSIVEWESRHGHTEHYIDTSLPFERINFLLGKLIEKGPEWSQVRKQAARRIIHGFAQQSLGLMTLKQQDILRATILSNNQKDEPEKPNEQEQELIDEWLEEFKHGKKK